jgi:hypothetical protein
LNLPLNLQSFISAMAQRTIDALEAWVASCPGDPEIHATLVAVKGLVARQVVKQVHARAAKHGHRAVTTAWTDAACEKRFHTMPAAIGAYSCDTHLMSKPGGTFVEHEPTMQSLKVSAQIPLADVALYDGQSLQDHLLANGAKFIPRKATVKVKSLLIYHPTAEVSLTTHAYAGVHTTSYAYTPGGTWDSVGVRCGDGQLGTCVDGQMKAFHFAADDPDEPGWCQAAQPPPFGPVGAGIDRGRNDIIMTVTLFRKPPPQPKLAHCTGVPAYPECPTFRSFSAAKVTAGGDLGFMVATPDVLAGLGDIDGVCIEIFRCMVVDVIKDTDTDVDDLCRGNLRMQADIGGNDLESTEKTAAKMTLERLEDMAYCTAGHGPWKYGSACPGCGAKAVCH